MLGVAMMASTSLACALVAHSPRERRVALLPVLAGQLTSSAMALLLVVGFAPAGWAESAWRAVFSVFAIGFPLFALSAWVFLSAAPGVHLSSSPTQSAPELPAPPKPVRLTAGGGKQP
jgi:xanthine/uracil permease